MEPDAQSFEARHDLLEREVRALTERVGALERQLALVPGLAAGTIRQAAAPPPLEEPLPTAAVEPSAPPPPVPVFAAQAVKPRVSLENRIGSQIFNRVGVIAVLLGVAWFLKLAISNGWIGPVGRVLVGLLAGVGLVLWSERFRRKGFPAFSYSLKAVGTSVLYLTIWAAFQLYALIPDSVALIAMLLVTAWNGYMAWVQDAELLGAYALSGAMSTPLLLSTGGNHEIFLFTYLLAIDVAGVLLVRLKRWPRLLLGLFPATVSYFAGWYVSNFHADALAITMLFVLAFFAAFEFPVFDPALDSSAGEASARSLTSSITRVLLPLANAAFVSLALYAVLADAGDRPLLPWLMVALAGLYLGLMRLPQPRVTVGLHLSLAVVFLTIAIPLKASGSWITVAWLVEGVALLWLGLRQPVTAEQHDAGWLLRVLGMGALLLGYIGALVSVADTPIPIGDAFTNRGFGTAAAGLIALALVCVLALQQRRRPGRAETAMRSPGLLQLAAAAIIAFNVLALVAVIRQIGALWPQISAYDPELDLKRALAVSAFLMLYGAVLLAAGFWQRSAFLRWQGIVLVIVTIAKTFLWDVRGLNQGYRIASFLGLGVLLMAISFAYQKDWLALRADADEPAPVVDADVERRA